MLNNDTPSKESTNIRDHLANERTFLAWVRTSIGIMAFGFVVEKFSLFIKEAAAFLGKLHFNQPHFFLQGTSPIFGITLVAFGALVCMLAFFKYKITEKQIADGSYKPSTKLNVLLTISILLVGILLVVYLTMSIKGS